MSNENLKERIRSGELLIGVSVPLNASREDMERIIEQDDYAFVYTDSQHGPFNEETLVEFCRHGATFDMPIQFRIKHTSHSYLIGNLLDLGPVGIEVPQVETIETVNEAVNSFYYPQEGGRSVGGEARYGVDIRSDRIEYGKWWNQTGFLSLQMESIRAVTTARKLAIDGVDCLTWGPNDLLYDIEAHPKHFLQTVDDCVKHVLDQLQETQVRISFRSYDYRLREKYFGMGATVLMERPRAQFAN